MLGARRDEREARSSVGARDSCVKNPIEMETIVVVTVPVLYLQLLVLLASVHGTGGEALTPAMFIFGDSLIDNGNNNFLPTIAKANYAPYGIDLGSPTGRFCNGLTAVDYGGNSLHYLDDNNNIRVDFKDIDTFNPPSTLLLKSYVCTFMSFFPSPYLV